MTARASGGFTAQPAQQVQPAPGLLRARVFMVLNVLSNSASNIVERLALSVVPPVTVSSIEVWTTAAISLLLRLVQARRDPGARVDARCSDSLGVELWHFAAAGLLGQVIGSYSFLTAARAGGIGFTVAIAQTWSLWAIVLGILTLREQGSLRLVIGLPAALVGTVLISTQHQSFSDLSGYVSTGLPWAIIASLCWAGSSVLIRRGLSRGADSRIGFVVQYLTASMLLAIRAFADPAPLAHLSLARVALIASAGILAGVLAMGLMYRALAICPISKVMLISASYPAIVNLLSWAILGELLTIRGVIGTLLVTSACVWTQAEKA
ncbi:MAG: DMT family transporter [Bacteroidota bacterium]